MTVAQAYPIAEALLKAETRLSLEKLTLITGEHAETIAQRLSAAGIAERDGDALVLAGGGRGGAQDIDLFVSYAHADDDELGTVRALVQHVSTLQLERFDPRPPVVFYDRRDIHARHDWQHRIRETLAESKAMLVVLSPAYFQSDYCREEWAIFCERERDLAHSDGAILNLYAVAIPGFSFDPAQLSDTWMKDLARRQWVMDVQNLWHLGPALFQHDEAPPFVERMRQEISALVDLGERILSSRNTVPKVGRYFVGRSVDLREVRDQLLDTRVGSLVAANGLGGMGKSALAFAYAQQYAADYPGGRFLVRAEGRTDLAESVLTLAPDLGVDLTPEEQRDTDAALRRIHAALTQPGQALLVFDNVDEADLLAPHQVARALPSQGVHVLATTRLGADEMHLHGATHAVGPLPRPDALALFDRFRPFALEPEPQAAREAADAIAEMLGDYPLALEVVAVYLWQHRDRGTTYEGYADRLRREGFGGLEATGADQVVRLRLHEERQLSRLLAPTLELLTDAERLTLQFASVLAPDAVVWPWLRALVAQERPGLVGEHVPGYPDPWATLRDRLHGLRLLTPSGEDARVSRMHRLVRDVVRADMGANETARLEAAAYAHLLTRGRFLEEGWVDRANRWELAPLRVGAEYGMERDDVRAADLAGWSSTPERQLGRFRDARRLLLRAIEIDRTHYDENHPKLAIRYSNLSLVEHALGDLPEARRRLLRAIEIDRTHYDENHPNLAIFYGNLSGVERALGDLSEARRLMLRAIEIDRTHYDEDHPKLATSYSNLSLVERALGDLPEARRLMLRAIEITELHFSPDHPNVASLSYNLSGVEHDLGDLPEARRLLLRAIEIDRTHYDEDHPKLATSYSNLSLVEHALGDLPEARRLLLRAIEITELHFSPDHPNVATLSSNLSLVEKDLGDLSEARRLMLRAIEIDRTHYDENHPNLAIRYSNLSVVEQDLGDLPEARRLMLRAIEIDRTHYDEDHPNLATRYSNLSLVEQALGELPEARRLLLRAIEIDRTHYDENHPKLATRYSNLSLVEQALGELPEARRLMLRAIEITELHFTDHPNLAKFYGNLAMLEWQEGDREAACAAMARAHSIFSKRFGPDHPNTQATADRLRDFGCA